MLDKFRKLPLHTSPSFTEFSPDSPISRNEFREIQFQEQDEPSFYEVGATHRQMIELNLGLGSHHQKQNFWKQISTDILVTPSHNSCNINQKFKFQSTASSPKVYFTKKKLNKYMFVTKIPNKKTRSYSLPKNISLYPLLQNFDTPPGKNLIQSQKIQLENEGKNGRLQQKKLLKTKTIDLKQTISSKTKLIKVDNLIQMRRKSCSCIECGTRTSLEFKNQHILGIIKQREPKITKLTILMNSATSNNKGFLKQIKKVLKLQYIKASANQIQSSNVLTVQSNPKETFEDSPLKIESSRSETDLSKIDQKIIRKCQTLPATITPNSQGLQKYLHNQRLTADKKDKRWNAALSKFFDKPINFGDTLSSLINKPMPMIKNSLHTLSHGSSGFQFLFKSYNTSSTKQSSQLKLKTIHNNADPKIQLIAQKRPYAQKFLEYQSGCFKPSPIQSQERIYTTQRTRTSPNHKRQEVQWNSANKIPIDNLQTKFFKRSQDSLLKTRQTTK